MSSGSSGMLQRGTLGYVNAGHAEVRLGDVRNELVTQEGSAGSLG